MKTLIFLLFFCFISYAEEETSESLSLPAEDKSNESQANPLAPTNIKPDQNQNKSKDNVGAILDFEGEIIEGERRRPDLFLQISIDNVKFDSLIYHRDDFNDYLEVDRKSRNKFFKMK